MAYGIVLIILVIIISGVIAYLGDQIGMKVGKKRISIFGLRPKYTSILITVLTGVLIASLTITAILATNNGVRQAIFNIDQVVSTLNELKTDLEDVNQQLTLKDLELSEMQEDILEREKELSNLQSTKDDLARENSILEEQKIELELMLEELEIELENAQLNIDELRDTKDDLEDQLAELNSLVNELSTEREELEEEIQALNKDYDSVLQSYELAVNDFNDTTFYYYTQDLLYPKGTLIYRDVIEKGKNIDEILDSISEFIDNANKEVLENPVEVDEESGYAIRMQEEDIFDLAIKIIESDRERFVISLVSLVNVAQNSPVMARFQFNESYIVFNEDELISRRIVNGNSSLADLEEELGTLFTNVNNTAVRNGVLLNEDDSLDTIGFFVLVQLVNDIQAIDGEVEVRVLADEEIWREDGWNREFADKLKFDLKKVDVNYE